MGLSRNSACLRIYSKQKWNKLSEYNIGSWANDGRKKLREFAGVCLIWVNQWVPKEPEKTEEKSVQSGPMKPLKMLYTKINRNCALKDRSDYSMTLNRGIFSTHLPWGRPDGSKEGTGVQKKLRGQDWSGPYKLGWSEAVLLTSLHHGRLGDLL